jgi:hypothetical protein
MLLQSALISIGTASSSWKQKEFVCPDSHPSLQFFKNKGRAAHVGKNTRPF